MELKKCECGQQVEFSWDEKCEKCSIKYCECGQETKSKWLDTCKVCYRKQEIKDGLLMLLAVLALVVLTSLVFATVIEYKIQINSFFDSIEMSVTMFYNSLSHFMQNFLKSLSVCLLVIVFLFFSAFILTSSSSRY